MKKLALTLCIAGSTLALAACNTTGTGNVETGPPYTDERTAGGSNAPAVVAAPVRAERTFRQMQSK